MPDATKRFEVEILIKAGLPKARAAEIAGVFVRTVHRVRAETEARSVVADGTDAMTVPEAFQGPAGGGPGQPSKTADHRELVASILMAQPGLKTLVVLRRALLAGYRGGKTALYGLVRELRPLAVRPICRFVGLVGELIRLAAPVPRPRADRGRPLPRRASAFARRQPAHLEPAHPPPGHPRGGRRDAANVLFHVVDERHHCRRSMVSTTNKSLER